MIARLSLTLALALPSLAYAQTPRGQQPSAQNDQQQQAPPPALTGLAATASGNVLVSPAPGTGKAVLEIAPDGSLVRTWPLPAGSIEVTDADAQGRPICVDPRLGKVFVLGADKPAKEIALVDIKLADVKALAPLARTAPNGAIYVPALDGTFVLVLGEGEPRTMRMGAPFPLTDFDVAPDGRLALLDSVSGKLRLHAAEGSSLGEVSLAGPGSPAAAFFALARYAPNGEIWVLELPSPEMVPQPGEAAAALLRLDAKGKRLARMDKHPGGGEIEAIAGFSAVDDGIWGASLDGTIRRIAKDGKLTASFDGTPAPPGIDWAEKRRLEKVALAPDAASMADVLGALAVTRGRKDGGRLFEKLRTDTKVSVPLVSAAVAKDQVDGGLLATLIAANWPETKDALVAGLKDPSPLVRAATVAVFRAPAVTGYDAELAAATKDTDRQVRGSALLVIRLQRWSLQTMPLAVARLSDEDPDVQLLAASVLAERLALTVGAVANVVKDPKANDATRTIAARTLIMDVPGGERLDPLPAEKRAPLKSLLQSPDVKIQRIGALALIVHGDDAGPAAIEKAWAKMETSHKRLAMAAWPPSAGDPGAEVLSRILVKEKNQDLKPEVLQALARTSGGAARRKLLDLATKPGGDERDRAVAVGLAARKFSEDQIGKLADELPSVGSELRHSIIELCAVRGVASAGPKIAALAINAADRQTAFVALYRMGSKDGVKSALVNIAGGQATPDVEYGYLAAVGGIPEEARSAFRELATGKGVLAPLAAEALARSGDAYGLATLVTAAKADRYGQNRDGAIAGALAALGAEGRKAAEPLLQDSNAATRENAALALALQGGDACKDLGSWGRSTGTAGISVPTAFFALASCGEITAAHELYRRSLEAARQNGDPVFQTAVPETFAALLAKMFRQPDFRPKADSVLGAVSGLPKPVVQAVAQALSSDLHPDVAGAAMKHVF